MGQGEQLNIIGTIQIHSNLELYKIVDFLNKNLKNKGLIFGLSQKDTKMTITIYET